MGTSMVERDRDDTADTFATSSDARPQPWPAHEVQRRLSATCEGWRSWSRLHQSYEGPWADVVHHSGRVLQGLTYQPTGAVIAAATTSLPEHVGGERNWDYRYGWIRPGDRRQP